MQYMSKRFLGNVDVYEEDYSDMFASLTKSINNLKDTEDKTTVATSLALNAIGSTSISLESFRNSTIEDLEEAQDKLARLKDFLETLDTEPEHTPLDSVPKEFIKFFMVTGNIEVYKLLAYCSPSQKKRKVTKSKTKMFF